MNPKYITRVWLTLAVALLAFSPALAQQSSDRSVSTSGKETLGPSADTIKPYRPAGRDPFKKEVKPKPGSKNPKVPRQIGFPALEARRAEYRQKVQEANARNLPEPNPVSQYLVTELDITGIFRDDNGSGAFVKAQPTGTMFFVRRGDRLYNGEVLRIEADEDSGAAKVLFREKSYLEVNGKQTEQERVVAKVPGALAADARR